MRHDGSPTSTDDQTEERLRLLVGLVVVTATICLAVAVAHLTAPPRSLLYPIALAGLVAVTNALQAKIRVRAQIKAFSSTSAAILVAIALLPPPWVVLCTAAGVALANGLTRNQPIKLAFNVGKDTTAAALASLAAHRAGLLPTLEETGGVAWGPQLVGLLAAAALYTVVDELLGTRVMALATGRSWRKVAFQDSDSRITFRLANLVIAVATVAILSYGPGLLLAMPPVVVALHLSHVGRLRAQQERRAWQRLAQTTDELNVVDLDAVLRTAVTRAAQLFSADQVDVEVHLGPQPRMVRGTADAIAYDGPPAEPPGTADAVIRTPLEDHAGGGDVGALRLRFRQPVTLSEREEYTLRTFASALCTAIRNASAYAELARAARAHAHAASHDPLTGLANRRELLERGTELLARRHADGVAALLLIDLNHFKEINDTLGHPAGDRVLTEVAHRLREAARPAEVVARLGGDEFAVLFSGLPAPAMAAHRAEGLLTALREPMELEGMRINVEASGGIAVAPGTGGMPELLRRADVAMYQAKRSGQRIATYARDRDTADVARLALGGDLPRAVAEHEFTVTFQPIVDLGTGEVLGAEALARWHHPDRGSIDPLRFLETVERSGLLPAFADAVLDQSLAAACAWRDAGFDLPVAVNVSPRSLLDPRFPSSVVARLQAHDLPPDRLFLELTETLTISQLEVVDRVLGQLRDAGIRLALDDFGTGYSSLSVLSRIPVHELKIDRAFVMAMENSPEAAAVVRSTVELGRSLELVVVAEGVESEPQRRALWELGCTAGQGHLFARPMPAPRLLSALRRGSGGRSGSLAPPLHDDGAVIRLTPGRRASGRGRPDRLPHLPA
ncbi:diguanylate cyclase (GGDEF) domain-containing protein [Micromonospora pattaloongensis]|uniref:Diguanylate cyclase (GGDEF) domain-containing protein n=1 Tax=Micromonospora pattaloongensis TaxID=405436 RepID=A0A1H3HUD9_9ACTN|nr:bifunctional diguanylate cyclase/phosphodiesterase [Micromonospora pattaloongensis]SDY18364.1 diguanylate cyclase (GGDEF) domain-containing protein [Micromonospora pattaloongensis]